MAGAMQSAFRWVAGRNHAAVAGPLGLFLTALGAAVVAAVLVLAPHHANPCPYRECRETQELLWASSLTVGSFGLLVGLLGLSALALAARDWTRLRRSAPLGSWAWLSLSWGGTAVAWGLATAVYGVVALASPNARLALFAWVLLAWGLLMVGVGCLLLGAGMTARREQVARRDIRRKLATATHGD